jgi:hypothetical protein
MPKSDPHGARDEMGMGLELRIRPSKPNAMQTGCQLGLQVESKDAGFLCNTDDLANFPKFSKDGPFEKGIFKCYQKTIIDDRSRALRIPRGEKAQCVSNRSDFQFCCLDRLSNDSFLTGRFDCRIGEFLIRLYGAPSRDSGVHEDVLGQAGARTTNATRKQKQRLSKSSQGLHSHDGDLKQESVRNVVFAARSPATTTSTRVDCLTLRIAFWMP